jgi:hypothetical protein
MHHIAAFECIKVAGGVEQLGLAFVEAPGEQHKPQQTAIMSHEFSRKLPHSALPCAAAPDHPMVHKVSILQAGSNNCGYVSIW